MERIRMAAFGTALGLALTTWFVARNVAARYLLEPWKNRRTPRILLAHHAHGAH